MSSLIYLVREPVNRLHPSLRPESNHQACVIGIEQVVQKEASSHAAQVVSPGTGPTCTAGQLFSYGELLQLVVDAGKIITL